MKHIYLLQEGDYHTGPDCFLAFSSEGAAGEHVSKLKGYLPIDTAPMSYENRSTRRWLTVVKVRWKGPDYVE